MRGQTTKGKKKVQAGENERFKRDCQNVTGGSGSGEVERSQFEAEQEVEATISVCETSPSSVCSDEDMHTACVTSSPPVGEHAVPVSVSLSSSLLAFASARVGWADLITLAGVALEAAEPTPACFFFCGSLFPSGRLCYLQQSSSSCCQSGGGIVPLQQWPPARPSRREIKSEP